MGHLGLPNDESFLPTLLGMETSHPNWRGCSLCCSSLLNSSPRSCESGPGGGQVTPVRQRPGKHTWELLFHTHLNQVGLAPHHVKREYNQWADDLTHPDFTSLLTLSSGTRFEE